MLLCGVDACVLCEIDRVMLDGMFVRFVCCVRLYVYVIVRCRCDLLCDVVWYGVCVVLCVLLVLLCLLVCSSCDIVCDVGWFGVVVWCWVVCSIKEIDCVCVLVWFVCCVCVCVFCV